MLGFQLLKRSEDATSPFLSEMRMPSPHVNYTPGLAQYSALGAETEPACMMYIALQGL